jgi:nucleoside-diphosphate-sugar epimerase
MNKVLNSRIAFVTGGSGFVGARLVKALVADGWEVRALARSAAASEEVIRSGATPIAGDLGDHHALRQAMAGSEVVFHVAAHFKLWGDRKEFDRINVEGMQAMIDAAVGSHSVKKVVAVSAAAVVMGKPEPMLGVDESSPIQTPDFAPYSASKAEGERILLKANGKRQNFETISIRPPMIWGDGMPTLDQLLKTVQTGQWQWVDNGVQSMSTCHVDNLVHVLLLAANNGRGGNAYFVADAETGTLKSVLGGLLDTKGVKAPEKSVSFGMAWRLAGVMGTVWRLFRLKGEPPITRQMLRLIGKSFTIQTEKARTELGYKPVISWKQGLTRMHSDK